MNINATLLGQAISFFLFVWFCMKYVWPPIMAALAERKKTIADGLSAAERAKTDSELAKKDATLKIRQAKQQSNEIIAAAQKTSSNIIEDARKIAKKEAQKIKEQAAEEIKIQTLKAQQKLTEQITKLSIIAATKILKKQIDAKTHKDILDKLVKTI
jgi:F-type H+-transporting ATPase subunit b